MGSLSHSYSKVPTIRLVVQDFAGPSTVWRPAVIVFFLGRVWENLVVEGCLCGETDFEKNCCFFLAGFQDFSAFTCWRYWRWLLHMLGGDSSEMYVVLAQNNTCIKRHPGGPETVLVSQNPSNNGFQYLSVFAFYHSNSSFSSEHFGASWKQAFVSWKLLPKVVT